MTKLSRLQKLAILDRIAIRDEGWLCFYCSRPLANPHELTPEEIDASVRRKDSDYPTLDHIIPKAIGGWDGIENLVMSCRSCNEAKKDDPRAVVEYVRRLQRQRQLLVQRIQRAEDYIVILKREAGHDPTTSDVQLGIVPHTPRVSGEKRQT